MAGSGRGEIACVEISTLEFIVEWAEVHASARHPGMRTTLTPPEVSLVAREAARLLGDRPLRGVTFGDLARLPALLESGGMAPAVARSACRDIGCALRAAIDGWGGRRGESRAAAGVRR